MVLRWSGVNRDPHILSALQETGGTPWLLTSNHEKNAAYMKNSIVRLIIVALALAAVACTASAQTIPDTLVSRRVRLFLTPIAMTAHDPKTTQVLTGTLSNVTADSITLFLHPQAAPVTVTIGAIDYIDLSRGFSRRRTALRVGLHGAILFGAMRSMRDDEPGPFVWAAGGFILGGIFGALIPPQERW